MKNIHVLPTEKPRIYNSGKVSTFNIIASMIPTEIVHNIYITSDEKFVRDEYVTDGIEVIKANPKLVNAQDLVDRRDWKKIILTTDQDLIKDGVRTIDDEFLKWFVNNPSCEYIKIEKWLDDECGVLYSRIIPKEEPKQDRTCTNNCSVVCGECQIFEPKQETLEELAKRYYEDEVSINAFINGAKWQQEQDKKCFHPLPYRLAKSDVNYECTLCGKFI
jgi:hypothetical protein